MPASDFAQKTKNKLEKIAGSQCSICSCLTTGGRNAIGEAAHINAASPGGARYDESQTDGERAHFNNGIWLCRGCHKKVDIKENSQEYPAERLIKYKYEHIEKMHNKVGRDDIKTIVNGSYSAFSHGDKPAIGIHILENSRNVVLEPGTQSSATGYAGAVGLKIGGK